MRQALSLFFFRNGQSETQRGCVTWLGFIHLVNSQVRIGAEISLMPKTVLFFSASVLGRESAGRGAYWGEGERWYTQKGWPGTQHTRRPY